jgi:putative flippase GtrA
VRHLIDVLVQYVRFGAVGLLATMTHVLAFTMWIELAGLAPWIANFLAFGAAVLISFIGHFYWSFRD